MRVVFIFVVLLVLLALAAPATFAVNFWLDGRAVISRAEQRGDLRPPSAGRLSMAEYTIAMDEFRSSWGTRAQPCRTFAFIWSDLTDNTLHGAPVSYALAGRLLGERPEGSIRWHIRRYVVACQLDQRLGDRQLLRLWLQDAYFGRELEGIEDASQTVFGKPSSALNRNESARLAVLLRSPGFRTQPDVWAERAQAIEQRVASGAP